MAEQRREPTLFDEAREDRTAEMLKKIIERLDNLSGSVERIETRLLAIIENQGMDFFEEGSPEEEKIESERNDEF